jgi:hypothetical protein
MPTSKYTLCNDTHTKTHALRQSTQDARSFSHQSKEEVKEKYVCLQPFLLQCTGNADTFNDLVLKDLTFNDMDFTGLPEPKDVLSY